MQSSRYKMYLGLLGRLDILISQGGDPEDIAAVKNLMRSYQYDRYASLVKERDHGSYRSPDPYLSCKRKEGTKSIPSLRGTDGTLKESPRGILKVVRDYYIELLGKGSPQCSEEGTSHGRRVDDFLSELTLPEHSDLSFDELVSEITIEEVTESIQQQNKLVSNTREATEVDDLILAYSAASASRVNRDKSVVFWCGKEGDQFPLPDGFPRAQPEIKILGVVFGPGDLALRNWTERLAIASSKVEESHRWKLTFRERVNLIKTYVLTVFGYVSNIFLLPRSLHARMFALFFRMLWGNRLNLIKREVTYLARKDGVWPWSTPSSF
ncbi:Hypothetical predicted protein [Pelobates cultripes]|uniref:Uncharacterized protein n=1 Tax=Pelobates cultripes TaxID=61616 RepID=A0AAD1W9G7_PELCU|nr:Hypothetical predicted protein [Pelobates cultripes]